MNDAPGRTLALLGTILFGSGILVSTIAGFVILFRLKRPGTDAVARRVALAGGLLGALGLALFAWAATR
jgi:hypothetical protein